MDKDELREFERLGISLVWDWEQNPCWICEADDTDMSACVNCLAEYRKQYQSRYYTKGLVYGIHCGLSWKKPEYQSNGR